MLQCLFPGLVYVKSRNKLCHNWSKSSCKTTEVSFPLVISWHGWLVSTCLTSRINQAPPTEQLISSKVKAVILFKREMHVKYIKLLSKVNVLFKWYFSGFCIFLLFPLLFAVLVEVSSPMLFEFLEIIVSELWNSPLVPFLLLLQEINY